MTDQLESATEQPPLITTEELAHLTTIAHLAFNTANATRALVHEAATGNTRPDRTPFLSSLITLSLVAKKLVESYYAQIN